MSKPEWKSTDIKPNNYQECILLVRKKDKTRKVISGEFFRNGADDAGKWHKGPKKRKSIKGTVIAWMDWPEWEEENE